MRSFRRIPFSLGMASRPLPRLFSTDPAQEFINLLQSKGHQKKGTLDTDLSPAEFDKLLGNDAELAAAFEQLSVAVQNDLSQLRTQERAASKAPVKVAVTGAAGAIGYAALFRIAAGEMLGPDQPIQLNLLELPQAKDALNGVVMELLDCAFPLVSSIVATDDVNEAFDGVDYALLVGAKPRSKGMERADLLKGNADIFKVQGAALNKNANRDTLRVVVVGNPANTNAWIASQSAPDISPTQFSAMTRLDHNRGLAQLSQYTNTPVSEIERFAIWGNHSTTMVPDISHTQLAGKWAKDVITDQKWVDSSFSPTVQNRGAEIIAARGASSAASAASAAIEHMRDWTLGTGGEWTSMGVWSDGSYGVEEGIYYSFPVVCSNGAYTIVQNVPIDPPTAKKMEASNQELISERDAVAPNLGIKKGSIKDSYNKWKQVFDKEGSLPFFYPPSV